MAHFSEDGDSARQALVVSLLFTTQQQATRAIHSTMKHIPTPALPTAMPMMAAFERP